MLLECLRRQTVCCFLTAVVRGTVLAILMRMTRGSEGKVRMNRLQANICLFTVTVCWSAEAILLKNVPASIPAFAVVFLTNGVGSIALVLTFLPHLKKMKLTRSLILNVAFLAFLNAGYNALYTFGIRSVELSTGEFTRMMTYVIAPIALLLLRRRVPLRTWVGIVFVIIGICVAVVPTMSVLDTNGALLVIASCVFEAVYIVRMNDYIKQVHAVDLIVLLFPMSAIFSGIAWVGTDPASVFSLQLDLAAISSLLMVSIFICGIAVVLNIYAQKTAYVQDVVIIYSLQIVFSTMLAATLPQLLVRPEPITVTVAVGCVLVCLGNLVAEIEMKPILRKLRGRHLEKLTDGQETGGSS